MEMTVLDSADPLVTKLDSPELTAAELNVDARVQAFKDELANIRAARASAVSQMKGIIIKINDYKLSQGQLLSQFEEEAYAMYPELVARDLKSTLESLSASHPLVVLWTQYSQKIDALSQSISVAQSDLDTAVVEASKAEEMEKQVLATYSLFAANSPAPVPSAEELQKELEIIEAIPRVDENNVQVTNVSALETLSPAAADMVMLQAMETFKEDDYHTDPDDMRDGEYTGTGELAQRIQTMTAGAEASVMPTFDKKKLIMIVGGLALAYVLFGGGRRERA